MIGAATERAAEMLHGRYRPQRQSRPVVLVAVLVLHLAAAVLLITQGHGTSTRGGNGGASAGNVAVFELQDFAARNAVPREGGGSGPALVLPGKAEADPAAASGQGGRGVRAAPGEARLGDELAWVLADDPFAGGGRTPYETILRRHIAAYSRAPTDNTGRKYAGMVILRFRVARDGTIVDVRVLRARSARLEEAALAALWDAEPLPPVPAEFDTPLEVDVPIYFKANG